MIEVMTFIRVYIESKIIPNTNIVITGDDFFYLKNVMRIKLGKIIKIFNQNDGEFFATIIDITKKEIVLEVDKKFRNIEDEKLDNIHLFISPLRHTKMSILVEKCVELGVAQITPVIMKNTAFDMDYQKYNTIIKEASEQSERLSFMKLNPEIKFEEFLKIKQDFIYLKERDEKALSLIDAKAKNIKNILVGPEGGFDESEFKLLEKTKGIPVYLGELILRAETAAIKAISVLSD